ncbi:unnamed protein product [Sphenostylis stenocarpa]|uniref:MADS-box domain-containing protein n=1 Tax=Sphenostylis stenocarpa TaxID=92480 RepID=A0AA86RQ98_9FABA|nr:unnamed protein product [Sphenostylis stenocarpa]
MPRRKKMTLQLIENFVTRKTRYRKNREILLKKVEDLATLCDLNACVIIYGPGDNEPTVWPSREIAKEMLDKFENAPLSDRVRKNVTPQLYIQQMNKKIENHIVKLKKKNDEKDVSNFMHKIHDGKSLSDFDASDISRLLCYVEGKLKFIGVKKFDLSEQLLSTEPPTPPVSFSLQNDIDSCADTDEQVFQQQSSIDSPKETGQMNSDSDNNIASNTGLSPILQPDVSDVDTVLPQVNFECLDLDDIDMVLPSGNLDGLIDDNDLGFGMLPEDNFEDLCDSSDLRLLYQRSSGESRDSDMWSSYESFGDLFSESDMMLPFKHNVQDNINETFIATNVENQDESINNIEEGHQHTFGANNGGPILRKSNTNFVSTTNEGNLNS